MHDDVGSFAALVGAGRVVTHHDQIGNSRSTRLPEKDAGFSGFSAANVSG